MANITLTVLHTAWNCRWSRLGYRLAGVDEGHQPETRWVCARPAWAGNRHSISDDECATCSHWAADQLAEQDPRIRHMTFALRPLSAVGHHWFAVAEHALLRSLAVSAGIMLAVLGLGLALSVVLLPVGLALGLVGAGVVVWGGVGDVFGDENTTPIDVRRS